MSDMFNYLIDRSQKKLVGVHAAVADKALELIELAYKQGINIAVTHGLRTFAEQDALYAQGRTKAGKKVTNAKGGQSIHNYGLAFDIAVFDDNKNPVWSGNGYNVVGKLGQQLGLEWGGAWKSFKDMPHFEYTFGLTLKQLQQGKRPSGSGTINSGYAPSTPKNYLEKGDQGTNVKGLQGKLQAVGINIGSDGIDGYYGADTERAVREFQKKYKLVADGVAGALTLAKLDEVYKVANQPKETKPEAKPAKEVKKEEPKVDTNKSTVSEQFKDEVAQAIKKGITNGDRPQDLAKREEVMVMVKRAVEKADTFEDYQLEEMLKEFTKVKDKLLLQKADEWETKLKDKTLTVSEAQYLMFMLVMRSFT